MRTYFTVAIAASLLTGWSLAATSCTVAQDEARDVKQYTIEQFLKTVNYSGASFSPGNDKILVSSDQTGVFNAYAIPVDGGDPVRVTDSTTDAINVLSYFPDDERFLYTSDQGGNELNHVYIFNPDGDPLDLTPGENLKAQFYGWSQDDETFYIGTNERDSRFFDVYEYNVDDFSREMIFKNEDGYFPSAISPDGQMVALSKINTRDDSTVFLFDRQSQEVTELTPHEGDINFAAADFGPEGKDILLVTDEGSDFRYLVRQNIKSGERETLIRPEWDVSFASLSKKGTYLVVGINADAKTELQVYNYASMEPVQLPEISGASVSSVTFSRDESQVAMYASSAKMPNDLFRLPIGGEEPVKLTTSLTSEIDPDDLVDGKVVRFKSFDGLEIPGILYEPHQASSSNRVPALVWVHGGPGGQSRVGYRGLIQYLVNNGYAIFAINNRGSSGYGKRFQQLDDQKHGEGDLDDCVHSKRMLVETGYVDPDRIGIIGGSYGGYMVLAALTFRPEEFEVGVDLFGISNWHRTLQNILPWWEAQRKALEKEMGDFSDEEYFKSISPLFHSKNIVRPLMVLQGANDPRVIKPESDDIVEAVRRNGVPVEYIVFDDEGHGFRKKDNQLRGYKAILQFLEQHLKKSEN